MCRKEISVAHGEKADVVHHSISGGHKKAESASSAKAISAFFVRAKPRSTVDQQVCRFYYLLSQILNNFKLNQRIL